MTSKPTRNTERGNTMSMREYAAARDLNVSTVSRQVRKGVIPLTPDGRIDPVAADDARARHLSRRVGGKPDRRARKAAADAPPLPVAGVTGALSGEAAAILAVIRLRWPELLQRLVLLLSGDPRAAALAVYSLQELTEYLALSLVNDLGFDIPDVLPPPPALNWAPEERDLLTRLDTEDPAWADAGEGERLVSAIIVAGDTARRRH